VSHRLSFALALGLVACGGRAAGPAHPGPAATAGGAVRNFMAAVADSDLAKMANYWGSAKGPAAVTHEPADYERRMVIIQSYLRNSGYKVLGESSARPTPGDSSAGASSLPADQLRQVSVQLTRANCSPVVPFVVVRSSAGAWIINQIDLAAAGTVYRNCGEAKDSTK
jgi:hypothetical protein